MTDNQQPSRVREMKKCNKCGEKKPESEFYWNRARQKHFARCKSCLALDRKEYRARNKEKISKANMRWHRANPQKVKAAQERWRKRNPGVANERAREWYAKNSDRAKKRDRQIDAVLKFEALNAYGGCKCAACGEENPVVLTIDHIAENGAEHRRQLFGSKDRVRGGKHFYVKLKQSGWPSGYQVLCYNCNIGKHRLDGEFPYLTNSEGSTTSRKRRRAKRPEAQGSVTSGGYWQMKIWSDLNGDIERVDDDFFNFKRRKTG